MTPIDKILLDVAYNISDTLLKCNMHINRDNLLHDLLFNIKSKDKVYSYPYFFELQDFLENMLCSHDNNLNYCLPVQLAKLVKNKKVIKELDLFDTDSFLSVFTKEETTKAVDNANKIHNKIKGVETYANNFI